MKKEIKFGAIEAKKKHKPSIDEQLRIVHIKLSTLEDEFRTIVSREVRELRNRPNNARAKERAKNALYSLMIVRKALDQLYDIDTSHALNKSMNALGVTLQQLNGINTRSDKVNSKKLNKGIEKMNLGAEKRDSSGMSIFKDDINDIVSDDVLKKLMSGASINSCLKNPDEAMQELEDDIDMISQNDIDKIFENISDEEIDKMDALSEIDDFSKFL